MSYYRPILKMSKADMINALVLFLSKSLAVAENGLKAKLLNIHEYMEGPVDMSLFLLV